MGLVSLTAVGAFDAVGSILVVALMIAPPATAYLLTDSLPRLLVLAAGIGAVSAVAGYWLAYALDASIAGSMATMTGVAFPGRLVLAPGRGLAAAARRRSASGSSSRRRCSRSTSRTTRESPSRWRRAGSTTRPAPALGARFRAGSCGSPSAVASCGRRAAARAHPGQRELAADAVAR